MVPSRAMTRGILVVVLALAACRGDRERDRDKPLAAMAQQCRSKDLGCPRPILGVHKLRSALLYYEHSLGFKVDWEWGDPADFASVTRGDMTVFLSESA